jgi:hypothetical protein
MSYEFFPVADFMTLQLLTFDYFFSRNPEASGR